MQPIPLRLEGYAASEDALPKDLGEKDRGRVWWVGFVWWIWHGTGWQPAIATRDRP
jgi:hypothetical protein